MTTLSYASLPTPWYRRKRVRLCLLLALVGVAAFAAYRWGPPLVDHARLLYWQRQCLAYTAPADVIAFDSTAAKPPAAPECWKSFRDAHETWPRDTESAVGAVVFLHERHTPAGKRRLVVVHAGRLIAYWERMLVVVGVAIDPATPTAAAAARFDSAVLHPLEPPLSERAGGRDSVCQLDFGQPDPDDPTHFTIPCTIDGKPGTIHGWLNDDDYVTFELR